MAFLINLKLSKISFTSSDGVLQSKIYVTLMWYTRIGLMRKWKWMKSDVDWRWRDRRRRCGCAMMEKDFESTHTKNFLFLTVMVKVISLGWLRNSKTFTLNPFNRIEFHYDPQLNFHFRLWRFSLLALFIVMKGLFNKNEHMW